MAFPPSAILNFWALSAGLIKEFQPAWRKWLQACQYLLRTNLKVTLISAERDETVNQEILA